MQAGPLSLRSVVGTGIPRGIWGWFALILVVVWACTIVGASPDALVSSPQKVGQFVARLWPPDFSPEFLNFLWKPLWETIALAIGGLVLAIGIGFPLALLGTKNLWTTGRVDLAPASALRGRAVYLGSRFLLDCFRAIPDIAWALIFVAAVGLGPVPGLLALGVSYGGVLGKIYAEIFESLDPYPAEALKAIGARRLGIVAYAYLPQSWSLLLSYTLYAWECGMRAAAVMGFVGAGGIGHQIDLSMRMFEYGQVATLVLALLLLIALVDVTSLLARRWLLASEAPRQVGFAKWGNGLIYGGLALLVASGLAGQFDTWRTAFSEISLTGVGRFLAGFIPPNLSLSTLGRLPPLMLETLAISIIGTLLGVAIGGILCIPAARTLTFDKPWADASLWWTLPYALSRLILGALRAIPEVLWALIFVLAVGLGPFAGVLAIGWHTGGVLGKLFAEALEEIDPHPPEALFATGAGRFAVFAYAALPLALPVMTAYVLLRWDMNLRVASILGFVGGGGLGQAVWEAIGLGFYDQLATLILVTLALVFSCDRLSARLRDRLAIGS